MHTTKPQLMKKTKAKKPKTQGLETSVFYYFNNLKRFKRALKKKKKDHHNRDWQNRQKSSIPAIRVNVAQPGEPKKKNNNKS